MKINDDKYLCDWCRTLININMGKRKGAGKHSIVSQLTCPNCKRNVSQKTKERLQK